ncbi:MAG TPA: hypothetical protein VGL84_09385 [Gaiellaceae bacterium]
MLRVTLAVVVGALLGFRGFVVGIVAARLAGPLKFWGLIRGGLRVGAGVALGLVFFVGPLAAIAALCLLGADVVVARHLRSLVT